MQISKRLIHQAKERALNGFLVLAQNVVADAEDVINRTMPTTRDGANYKVISEARHLFYRDRNSFLVRLDGFYRDYVDRAMQTMYINLRPGLDDMSADRLSLIDDETINRQMEVDRLVTRMREADNENLGRLNIVIAQLHGSSDVRERENPFRPYLIARALHEALASTIKNEAVLRLLFDTLSNAIIRRLPGFYAPIREAFESGGVRPRLLARPGAMSRAQRALLEKRNNDMDAQIAPKLERIAKLGQRTSDSTGSAATDARNQGSGLQDFISQIFNQQRPLAGPRAAQGAATAVPAAAALVAELGEQQKIAARTGGNGVPDRILSLRDKIDTAQLDNADRMPVEVVALLFEFILQDELIPAELRGEFARLSSPFLKAALLAPELLHDSAHPARQFVNRLGAISAALDPEQAFDRRIAAEISRTITSLLETFEEDMTVFSQSADKLNLSLATLMRNADTKTARVIDAIEEVEKLSILHARISDAVRNLLSALMIDQRVVDFIQHIWVRVLVRLFCRDMEVSNTVDAVTAGKFRNLLPELIWSVQPARNSEERGALMRLLPDLAKRLKAGLELIGLPETEVKHALDQLVEVHMQVLRPAPRAASGERPDSAMTLEQLVQYFAPLAACEGNYEWTDAGPLKIQRDIVRSVLAQHGVTVVTEVDSEAALAFGADDDWLAEMRHGIGVEILVDGAPVAARLAWVSKQRALFLFTHGPNKSPMLYSSVSLLKALRDGVIYPFEYAPLFERAIESLITSAESVSLQKP